MAKITPDYQSAFFEMRPHNDSVPFADKKSFLDNDTTISLILPYFNSKQLVHAEIINRRFHNNITRFYLRVENFSFMTYQETRVQGFIDKICNCLTNIKRLEVGRYLRDMKPLSKLNLMKKLRSILLDCTCTEIEFQTIFLIALKSVAHQLQVLDLYRSRFIDFSENNITNRHFLNDFVLLEELRLSEYCRAYLPSVTLPKLLILQYFYKPNRQNLLHQFCQQNLQIEKLCIDTDINACSPSDSVLFPSSSLAVLHNLHVLRVHGRFSINGDFAKQFVDYNRNLADLSLEFCNFESDEALQMIYDVLQQRLVKLELNEFRVSSVKAIRGIHKLQNLQHLKIHWPYFPMENVDADSISIEDFLSLKALRFLDIHNIPIRFGMMPIRKFNSLDELTLDGMTENIKLLDYCTDSLTKLTIKCLPKNANEFLIQLSIDFPNLISLCCYLSSNGCCNPSRDKRILAEETARVMSNNLANLKHLNAPYVFSLTSLILFFQNCKCLTNIKSDYINTDALKNHPVIKDAQNCGRYIEIH